MLCVFGVFVAIRNTRNSLTTKRHAPVPARSVASLPASRLAALACYAVARRSSPLSVGLRCVASLRRSGLHFLFVLYRWLRGYAAPPPATVFRPLRGSNLGSLTLANCSPTSDLSRWWESMGTRGERNHPTQHEVRGVIIVNVKGGRVFTSPSAPAWER